VKVFGLSEILSSHLCLRGLVDVSTAVCLNDIQQSSKFIRVTFEHKGFCTIQKETDVNRKRMLGKEGKQWEKNYQQEA